MSFMNSPLQDTLRGSWAPVRNPKSSLPQEGQMGPPVRHPKSPLPLEGQLGPPWDIKNNHFLKRVSWAPPVRHQKSVHPQEGQLKVFNLPFLRSPKKWLSGCWLMIEWFQSNIFEKAPKIWTTIPNPSWALGGTKRDVKNPPKWPCSNCILALDPAR